MKGIRKTLIRKRKEKRKVNEGILKWYPRFKPIGEKLEMTTRSKSVTPQKDTNGQLTNLRTSGARRRLDNTPHITLNCAKKKGLYELRSGSRND